VLSNPVSWLSAPSFPASRTLAWFICAAKNVEPPGSVRYPRISRRYAIHLSRGITTGATATSHACDGEPPYNIDLTAVFTHISLDPFYLLFQPGNSISHVSSSCNNRAYIHDCCNKDRNKFS